MSKSEKDDLIMNEGIRTEKQLTCILCECKGTALYQNLRDRHYAVPGTWSLLRCSKCRLVWLNPQPIPEDIGKLYSEYVTHNVAPETPLHEPIRKWRKKIRLSILFSAFGYWNDGANKLLGWLASLFTPLRDIPGGGVMWLNGSRPGKLLDVGCGNGNFLAEMRKLGWEVTGVEPDEQALKVARERFGLRVFEGVLEEISFPDDTFDAITLSHVAEHLPDLIITLTKCRRILKKGGRLVITTPNIESLCHRLYRESCLHLDPPRHLFLFSPHSLRDCVERSGLQVMELRTTSRMANFIRAASSLIRHNGTLPGGLLPKQSIWLQLGGVAFQVFEHSLSWITDAGEEIVLFAGKGDYDAEMIVD